MNRLSVNRHLECFHKGLVAVGVVISAVVMDDMSSEVRGSVLGDVHKFIGEKFKGVSGKFESVESESFVGRDRSKELS